MGKRFNWDGLFSMPEPPVDQKLQAMKVMTHEGIVGCLYIPGEGFVKLRETMYYWITEHGVKFRKDNGFPAGDRSGLVELSIDSIKKIKSKEDSSV